MIPWFPIMGHPLLNQIPSGMLEECRARVEADGVTLEQLALSGGLTVTEACLALRPSGCVPSSVRDGGLIVWYQAKLSSLVRVWNIACEKESYRLERQDRADARELARLKMDWKPGDSIP